MEGDSFDSNFRKRAHVVIKCEILVLSVPVVLDNLGGDARLNRELDKVIALVEWELNCLSDDVSVNVAGVERRPCTSFKHLL